MGRHAQLLSYGFVVPFAVHLAYLGQGELGHGLGIEAKDHFLFSDQRSEGLLVWTRDVGGLE